MANQEHVDILLKGAETWNRWREQHPNIHPDLSYADLNGDYVMCDGLDYIDLKEVNLEGADLRNESFSDAYFNYANLKEVNLENADLSGSDFIHANLSNANLSYANLRGANLSYADLSYTTLIRTDLRSATLVNAIFNGTALGNVDLRTVKGLETVVHNGPSTIGTDTLERSQGDIPEVFLRGVGLSNTFIKYARAMMQKPLDYYTCFISYSSKDEMLAKRLHSDLQREGVLCWFAPHDLRPGDWIRKSIDEAISIYDKLLLILSKHSVNSQWVTFEVEAALEKEQNDKRPVLFPIRLDETVSTSTEAWAKHMYRTRHIGDFTQWNDHEYYQASFARLLRDLKAEGR